MNDQKTLEPLKPGEKYCKTCKERIAKSASTCPKCGGRQGLPIWAKLLIVFAVIFTCLVGCVGGCTAVLIGASDESETSSESKTEPTVEKEKTYIKVSKDDLDEALESNAAVAQEKYKNKYVEVSGKLGTIDSDLKYFNLMSSTDEWDFNGIYCKIKNSKQKDVVKTLKKNQEIVVKGKIYDVGEFLGYYLDIDEIITK